MNIDKEYRTEDPVLKQLIYDFYKGNLNICLESEKVQYMDWEWQHLFLESTVNSKLLKQYPISSKFSKLFLKKIIEFLEPSQEVHDDLYAHLCTAMKESNQDGFCYRHYVIGKDLDRIITMKETRNMVVNGTTGLKTWEAALMLSDWALCNKNIFANKNVLELGSGVGFAGITIGKMCSVKSMLLTDCHEDVLKTISENIVINFPHLKKEEYGDTCLYKDHNLSIGVTMLDWNNLDHLRDSILPDVIIGADIVYDPTIVKPLCHVIQWFCKRNKSLEVYIASVVRNEETFNGFMKTLNSMDFCCDKIEMEKSVFIEWDENAQKCLLKIKLK